MMQVDLRSEYDIAPMYTSLSISLGLAKGRLTRSRLTYGMFQVAAVGHLSWHGKSADVLVQHRCSATRKCSVQTLLVL